MARIRVLIIDDHELVRVALRSVLEQEPNMEVAGEAPDGASGIKACEELAPDVVLLDLRLPDQNGAQVCAALRTLPNPPRVLILTSYDEDEEVFGALQAGASGYIMKDIAPSSLVGAVASVAEGQTVLDAAVAGRVIKASQAATRQGARGGLSAREIEVLGLMARGMSNREIAKALWVSEATVKTHVSHLLHKLDAGDRTQAVLLAIRRRLIDVDAEE